MSSTLITAGQEQPPRAAAVRGGVGNTSNHECRTTG
jgi:hypothetical protein